MKNRTRLTASIVILSAIPFATFQASAADDANAEEKSNWEANVEFGYVATSGNTKTTSVNSGFDALYKTGKWEHSLALKSIFGSAEDSTTSQVKTNAERYFIEGKTDYKYAEGSYAFLLANYDDDRFSDNDYQSSISGGRGYSLKPGETSKLDLELGFGYRKTVKKETATLPQESINETIFRLAANYEWKITENSKFEQKLTSDIGEDNTVTKSYTGLSANFAKNLALKLSLTATHQSEVRVDTEQLDTVTAVTVVYNF